MDEQYSKILNSFTPGNYHAYAVIAYEFPQFNLGTIIEELKSIGWIVETSDQIYVLSQSYIDFKSELPPDFSDNPYGYYKHLKKQLAFITIEKLDLEITKLRNEYDDYDNTKKYARAAVIISAVLLVLELIKLIKGKW